MNFKRVFALMEQYFIITYRTIDRIADILFWPILSIMLWGFMSSFLASGYEVNLIGQILAGFIFYQFFQRSQTDIPLYLLEDFWSDNLQNVFSTPVTKWDKLTSLIFFSILKGSITLFITYIFSRIFFGFNLFSIDPLYICLYFFSLLLFAIALGIFLSGIIFRYGTNVQMIAWGAAFFLQPMMAVFYPISVLPKVLQIISRFIPATYVFEGLRELQSSGSFNQEHFFLSLGLNAIAILVGCLVYSWSFNYNKSKGNLVHAE